MKYKKPDTIPFEVRVPKALKDKIKEKAGEMGTSEHSLWMLAIDKYIKTL